MFASTLTDALRRRAAEDAGRTAIRYVAGWPRFSVTLDYGTLDRRACALGARLATLGMRDRPVAIATGSAVQFAVAYFGCLYAGAVPVPAPSGRVDRVDRTVATVREVSSRSGAALVVTDRMRLRRYVQSEPSRSWPARGDLLPIARIDLPAASPPELERERLLALESVLDREGIGFEPVPIDPRSPACLFIDVRPRNRSRAELVSHAALIADARRIVAAATLDRHSTAVAAMPWHLRPALSIYLAGSVLVGFPSTWLLPAEWGGRASHWLNAIDRFGATHAGATETTYRVAARERKTARRRRVDLSSWRVVLDADERITHATRERFRRTHASHGFRATVVSPSMAASGTRRRGDSGRRTVQRAVSEILGRVLSAPSGAGDRLPMNRLDRATLVEINAQCRIRFGVALPFDLLRSVTSVRALADRLQSRVGSRRSFDFALSPESFAATRAYAGWRRADAIQREALAVSPDGGRAAHEHLVVSLVGVLDEPRLQAAWQHVIEAHPALRLRLDPDRDDAWLRVDTSEVPPLAIIDASGWSSTRLARALRDDAKRPFDLTRPPVLRARLYRASEVRHALSWSASRIAVDAVSLWQTLVALLEAYDVGSQQPVAAPLVPLPYVSDRDRDSCRFAAVSREPQTRPVRLLTRRDSYRHHESTAECVFAGRALECLEDTARRMAASREAMLMALCLRELAVRFRRERLGVAVPLALRDRRTASVCGNLMQIATLDLVLQPQRAVEQDVQAIDRALDLAAERVASGERSGEDPPWTWPDVYFRCTDLAGCAAPRFESLSRVGASIDVAGLDVSMQEPVDHHLPSTVAVAALMVAGVGHVSLRIAVGDRVMSAAEAEAILATVHTYIVRCPVAAHA